LARSICSRSVATLDLLSQADLIILGQQWVLPDIGQVEADEVLFVAFYSLFRQGPILRPRSDVLARSRRI